MIQFGNDKIKEIYVGSDKIKEVYHGSDLVWSGKKPSYLITTDNTRIDFELENTPIGNFGTKTGDMDVANFAIAKSNVRDIFFGTSYSNINTIPSDFLAYCYNIKIIDLSNMKNVININGSFLFNYPELCYPDIIKLGFSVPTTATYDFMKRTYPENILVPIASVQAYKTTAPWSTHASKITGY